MLKALELENFKAFGERTRIEFAPITLIFGENSAGKSSILQALNLLKQTCDSRERGAALLPRAENGLVDLGSFKELLFNHDLEKELSFKLDIELPCDSQRTSGSGHDSFKTSGELLGLELSFGRSSESAVIALRLMTLYGSRANERIVSFSPIQISNKELRSNMGDSTTTLSKSEIRRVTFSTPGVRAAKCVWLTEAPRFWTPFFREAKEHASAIIHTLQWYDYPYVQEGALLKVLREGFEREHDDLRGQLAETVSRLCSTLPRDNPDLYQTLIRVLTVKWPEEYVNECLREHSYMAHDESRCTGSSQKDVGELYDGATAAASSVHGIYERLQMEPYCGLPRERFDGIIHYFESDLAENVSQLCSALTRANPDRFQTLIGLLARKWPEEQVSEFLRRYDFQTYEESGIAGTAQERSVRLFSRALDLAKRIGSLFDRLESLEDDVSGFCTIVTPEGSNPRSDVDGAVAFYGSDFTLDAFVQRMKNAQVGSIVGLDGFIPVRVASTLRERLPEFKNFAKATSTQYNSVVEVEEMVVKAGQGMEAALDSLYPMGPFRRPPERWYIFTGTSPRDVGYRGELLPDLLFQQPKLVDDVNEWLDRLEIGYHLKVQTVGTKANDLFEVRLMDRRNRDHVDVSWSDVGYGISQILPFVVQSLAGKDQIVTIEQPEVHIHPRLQADIGDLLIHATQEPRSNCFIVETHSEHLILRLLRRIRETHDGDLPPGHPGLKPDQISVIYVERGENGSKAHRLQIDETGEFIDRWPKGFFEERARELF